MLYPLSDSVDKANVLEFKSEDGASVKIIFIDLVDISDSILEIMKTIKAFDKNENLQIL